MERSVLIFLAAQSPRRNVISARRIEGLAHYISGYFDTYVVSGIPQNLNQSEVNHNYDIGSAKLVEIPPIFNKKRSTVKESTISLSKHSAWHLEKIARYIKREVFPILQMFFPVSPGGMVYQNQRKFLKEAEKIVIENYGKRRIYIFASYGPSFILRIANKIKKKYPSVDFVADFRDWAYLNEEGFFYDSIIYKLYTKSLLKRADKVTFVSKIMLNYYKKKLNLRQPLLHLSNGFDNSKVVVDSGKIYCENTENREIHIVYTGSIYYKNRNPECFIQCIGKYTKLHNKKIVFLYASKNVGIMKQLVEKYGISSIFEYKGFLSHEDSLKLQREADILLLLAYTGKDQIIGSSIITGKLFEYLASGRPILVIGPEHWEMREVVEADGLSRVISDGDYKEIERFLDNFPEGMKEFNMKKRAELLEKYGYRSLSENLRDFLMEGHNELL